MTEVSLNSTVFSVEIANTGIIVEIGQRAVSEGGGSGGAVDSVNGQTGVVVLTTGNIADSANKRYVTDANLTVIGNTSGTNTGNETTTTLGALINSATTKTPPIDADQIGLMDSANGNILKKLSWSNIKATLLTYFNTAYITLGYLDTDVNLTANSDTKIATQKAIKTYADALIGANDAMVFKGVIDCSANPNYPAASTGWTYKVSVAGKIGGGASGVNVEVGDSIMCLVDGTASGNHATVGANWNIIQVNVDGAVIGAASSTDRAIATFSGTGGKLIQNNTGATIDASGNITATNLSGTNTGNETATTIGALINSAAAKTTPIDADMFGIMDSAASNILKKLSWANVKATLSTATLTFTNKRITRRVEALTDGTTITPNADDYDQGTVTIAGNRTMAAPTGTPTEGQNYLMAIKQDGTGTRTITWNAIYRFAGGTPPTLTTTASKTDIIGFRYNANDSKWDCIGGGLGY